MKSLKLLVILLGGLLFGFGLSFSGMTKPEVVLSFLQLSDLGLLFVLGGAILITMFSYNILPKIMRKPLINDKFLKCSSGNKIKKTIFGAVIFGIGWGVSGVCPATAIAGLGTGNYPLSISIVFIFLGAYIQGRFFE